MPMFLSNLKRHGYLNRIHINVGIIGSRKLDARDNYAKQGWDAFAPNVTIYGFDADPAACEALNDELAKHPRSWTEKHLPYAIWSSQGKQTLYRTDFPGCSSLLPPNPAFEKRFMDISQGIKLVGTEELETTTLDAVCASEGLTSLDFLQLDVQGGELEVLKGAVEALKRGTLAIRTEVEFTEIYKQQPLFGDIDAHLRQNGFSLFDLDPLHYDMRKIPLAQGNTRGTLVWGDGLYFRDLLAEGKNDDLKTPENVLKLACLADVLNLPDYALEILSHLTLTWGEDPQYNLLNVILETLSEVEVAVKHGIESLPGIAELIEFCDRLCPTESENLTPQQIVHLRHKAYRLLLLKDYAQSSQLYETLIELEPEERSNYWHLGLAKLLQEQEEEAQVAWFMGVGEGTPEQLEAWTQELIEALESQMRRSAILEDTVMISVLQAHILELSPDRQPLRLRPKYCYLEEESVIEKYLNLIKPENHFCVDLAASDGMTMSNTYFLFQQGWSGLAIEGTTLRFSQLAENYLMLSQVSLLRCMVYPSNIVELLKAHQVPQNFDLFNLDIDGYEYFILDALLPAFRPRLICVEINENIPPPIKFTVKYDPEYFWRGDRFFGQSISQLQVLCDKYKYSLVELHYNNAFLIPQEICPVPAISPEEAFKVGYQDRPDRKAKFPWDANIEPIHHLEPEAAFAYMKEFFAPYEGQYECSL